MIGIFICTLIFYGGLLPFIQLKVKGSSLLKFVINFFVFSQK